MKIVYSQELEARRIIYTLRTLQYSPIVGKVTHQELSEENVIVLPKFTAKTSLYIAKLLGDRNEPESEVLVKYLAKCKEIKKNRISKKNLDKLIKNLQNNINTAFRILGKQLKIKNLNYLTFQITSFGTAGSFCFDKVDIYKGVYNFICLRRDYSLPRVLYLLLRHYFAQKFIDLGFAFNQQQEITMYLTNKLLGLPRMLKTRPYFKGLIFQKDELARSKKRNFQGELSFINDFFVNYQAKKIDSLGIVLNGKENKILKLLENNKGKVCDFDQIAEIIWGDGWTDKFSLDAIYKYISRIKEKLAESGKNPNSIVSVSGRGYLLQ